MHFVTGTTPIDDIDGKSHKTELNSSHNYSTNRLSLHYVVTYLRMASGGYTCTHTVSNPFTLLCRSYALFCENGKSIANVNGFLSESNGFTGLYLSIFLY